MKPIIASLALLAAGCQASIVVPDVGDGVWTVRVDHTGTPIDEPTLIAHLNATSHVTREHSAKLRRQSLPNPDVTCNSYAINVDDFNSAWAGFDSWIGTGLEVGGSSYIWATCGSAVAYMCNYADEQPA